MLKNFDPTFTINSWKALLASNIEIKAPFVLVAENSGETIKIRCRQL